MTRADCSRQVACPDCDVLFLEPLMREGEQVVCPRCGANILSCRPNAMHRVWSTRQNVRAASRTNDLFSFPHQRLEEEHVAIRTRYLPRAVGAGHTRTALRIGAWLLLR